MKNGKTSVNIYTDGSWWQNRQGSAAVFNIQKDWYFITEYVDYGTNNRAELLGPIIALEFLQKHKINFDVINIYSDSQYVINTINNGWRKRKNVDLWQRIDPLIDLSRQNYRWVRGHDGNIGNELADRFANECQETKMSTPKLTKIDNETGLKI